MIQFNLLPDVKKDYIKAKRTKRLIITVSFLASAISLAVMLILFGFVQVVQKNHIDDLSNDISSEISSLRAIEDLDKTLTVQNQLTSLPALHQDKPQASRLFNYLNQVTPETVKIRSVNLDFEQGAMTIEGSAETLAQINQYADTLKFATYIIKGGDGEEDIEGNIPFTNVATQLSRNEELATYEITLSFDETLFDNTQDISLVVPTQVTTRSVTGKPSTENSLFENNPDSGGQ